jgi:hypothetical protein
MCKFGRIISIGMILLYKYFNAFGDGKIRPGFETISGEIFCLSSSKGSKNFKIPVNQIYPKSQKNRSYLIPACRNATRHSYNSVGYLMLTSLQITNLSLRFNISIKDIFSLFNFSQMKLLKSVGAKELQHLTREDINLPPASDNSSPLSDIITALINDVAEIAMPCAEIGVQEMLLKEQTRWLWGEGNVKQHFETEGFEFPEKITEEVAFAMETLYKNGVASDQSDDAILLICDSFGIGMKSPEPVVAPEEVVEALTTATAQPAEESSQPAEEETEQPATEAPQEEDVSEHALPAAPQSKEVFSMLNIMEGQVAAMRNMAVAQEKTFEKTAAIEQKLDWLIIGLKSASPQETNLEYIEAEPVAVS